MWKNPFYFYIKNTKSKLDDKRQRDKIVIRIRTRSDVEGRLSSKIQKELHSQATSQQ